jgi:radical SAM superfamily enzyme YgiQ (UPF0313 family)
MKLALIRPPAPNLLKRLQILNCEPLELEYLYTVAKANGWEAYIYDGFNSKSGPKEFLAREAPDVVAITGYNAQQDEMIRYAKIAKSVNPNVITVIGGVHAQLNYENFYGKAVDYVFRSEDVNAFGRLLKCYSPDNNPTSLEILENISGLCRKAGDGYLENELAPFDINELPIPDRSFFYANKSWFRYLELTEVATIKTSISCPYDCKFCYCSRLNAGRYSARNLDLVFEELFALDCENVMIADDDFLFDPDRILDFIGRVKKLGVRKKFICYARADFIAKYPDIIKKLTEIGFVYFLVGLESVSDKELDNYNKRVTAEINERCVSAIKAANARCFALMIVPVEATKSYFEELYEWILARGLNFVSVSIFTPFPKTPMFEEYKDKIISNNISDWDFLHLVVEPPNMTRREFYAEYLKLTYRLYKLAKKTGIYEFINLEHCKNIFLDYFREKFREKR